MTQDVSFCVPKTDGLNDQRSREGLLASATGARVDIWRLQQQEEKEDDEDEHDGLTPIHTLRRFTEMVTAIKLREDGQILLAGDKLGKIEMIELNQKIALRTYENDHKN